MSDDGTALHADTQRLISSLATQDLLWLRLKSESPTERAYAGAVLGLRFQGLDC